MLKYVFVLNKTQMNATAIYVCKAQLIICSYQLSELPVGGTVRFKHKFLIQRIKMSELNCTNNRLASTSSANRKWKWSKSARIAVVTVLSLFIVFLLYDIVSLNWEINKTNKLIRTLHGNGSSNQSVPVPAPISGLSQDLPKNCADVSKRQLPLPGVYVIHVCKYIQQCVLL